MKFSEMLTELSLRCFPRIHTISSIRKLSSNPDYNFYSIRVFYDYDPDGIIADGITDTQSFVNAVIRKALPGLPVHIKAPDFGCCALIAKGEDGEVFTGRGYDFGRNTSAMLVRCYPRNGFRSMALCALDNIGVNDAGQNLRNRLCCLTAPYLCLDGINEKGVFICVLTLDSEPACQQSGKPVINTSLAIRLVLDRAASTQEAVDLLRKYDMRASAGRDYHFYITDASGDGRVIEYDCEKQERPLIDISVPAVTNFFSLYENKVLPHQLNGIYGHGKERYDIIREVQKNSVGEPPEQIVWKALRGAAQHPKEGVITSNTQWSALYRNHDRTLDVCQRRNWDKKYSFPLDE